MLIATNVVKEYQTRVLDGIDFTVDEHEFVAIMGPSGSGKSTFLHALSGLDRPTSGDVLFDGTSFATLSEAELSHLRLTNFGFVFQQPHLLQSLNILDNIVLPGFLAGETSRPEIVQRAKDLMERAGIADLHDRTVTEVSGGQLQRAGICRALINNPKVLFGDEPTGALNSATSAQILDVLQEINHSGTTIVLVTHDPMVAVRAHRLVVLIDGNIGEELHLGPYDPIDAQARHKKVMELMVAQGV